MLTETKRRLLRLVPPHLDDVSHELAKRGAVGKRESRWFRRLAIVPGVTREISVDTRVGASIWPVIARQYAHGCGGSIQVSPEGGGDN